jgi:uncharacterized DUF497 family protein
MNKSNFDWDEAKNLENQEKHGVSFYDAQHAFKDGPALLLKMLCIAKMKNVIFVLALINSKLVF